MSARRTLTYDNSVFINCPFDEDYKPIFHAIVFAVQDLGFAARSAKERDDSGENRLAKILDLIECSKYGIHDLSRVELSSNELPRFNMPLELGLFLGCKRYGSKKHKGKITLVLDKEPYRYHESTSDLSGCDIKNHSNSPEEVIHAVSSWLRASPQRTRKHGATEIVERYNKFKTKLPQLCDELRVTPVELAFSELVLLMEEFIIELDSSA